MSETERVYFSHHADNELVRHCAHGLMSQCWAGLLDARENQDFKRLMEIFVELLGKQFFEHLAEIVRSAQTPSQKLQDTARYVLVLGVFTKTMVEWPQTDEVDVEFCEEHAHIIDRQMQDLWLQDDETVFWALFHLTLGRICQALDADKTPVLIVLPKRYQQQPGSLHLSTLDLVQPIYDELRTRTALIPEMKERLELASDILVQGAQRLFVVSKQLLNG